MPVNEDVDMCITTLQGTAPNFYSFDVDIVLYEQKSSDFVAGSALSGSIYAGGEVLFFLPD